MIKNKQIKIRHHIIGGHRESKRDDLGCEFEIFLHGPPFKDDEHINKKLRS